VDFLLVLIEFFSPGVTAEAIQVKIDRKSSISLQCGQFNPKFQVEVVAPPIIFARIVRPMNALQLWRWQFSDKETWLSSSEVRSYTENGRFAFLDR